MGFLNKNTVLLKRSYILKSRTFWKNLGFEKRRERRKKRREGLIEYIEASKELGVFLLLLM